MTFKLEIQYSPIKCEEVFNDFGQPQIEWTVQLWNKEMTLMGYPTMKQLCIASDTQPHHWIDGFIFGDLTVWQQWDLFEFILNDLEIIEVATNPK